MINIIDFQKSFLIKWMKYLYMNKEAVVCNIPQYYYNRVGNDLSVLQSNIPSKKFKGIELIKSSFWSSVLSCWLDFTYDHQLYLNDIHDNLLDDPEAGIRPTSYVIWNNSSVTYRNNPLFYLCQMYCRGVWYS